MAGTLYRLFDADGNLLYVGASMSAAQRLSQHESDKGWWPEVDLATFEHYETRDEAFDAENKVLAESPGRHNKAGCRRGMSDADREARKLKRAEADKRRREEWDALYAPEGVCCENCGKAPHRLPKGELIGDVPCPNCGCETLVREAS